jgi:hypothetical protein
MAPTNTPLIRELIFANADIGRFATSSDPGTPASVSFAKSRLV